MCMFWDFNSVQFEEQKRQRQERLSFQLQNFETLLRYWSPRFIFIWSFSPLSTIHVYWISIWSIAWARFVLHYVVGQLYTLLVVGDVRLSNFGKITMRKLKVSCLLSPLSSSPISPMSSKTLATNIQSKVCLVKGLYRILCIFYE